MPVVLGAGAGLAATLIMQPLLPSRPRLGAALDRLRPDAQAPISEAVGDRPSRQARLEVAIGRWALRRLPAGRFLALDPRHLAVTGTDGARLTGQRLFGMGAGLLLMPILTLAQVRAGTGVTNAPVAASLLLAAAGFMVPSLLLRQRARAAQLAMAQAAVAFMQVSAIARAGGAGIVDTVGAAAEAFDTPAYLRLRDVLELARWSGQPAWQALQEEGERIGVPEISEVGDLLRLANSTETGAHIYQTLRARARSLRQSLLAREIQRERGRTVLLTLAAGGMVTLFIIGIMFPFVVNLLSSPMP